MANKYAAYFILEQEVHKVTQGTLNRSELIDQFTDGRKDSLKDLTPFEYKELLKWMKTSFKLPEKDWRNTPENKMRRKIIVLFKKMNYVTAEGRADMDRINAWCEKYSSFHKSLGDHSRKELITLTTQAEKVYESFTKSLTLNNENQSK